MSDYGVAVIGPMLAAELAVQAALLGIINRLYNIRLDLIEVRRLPVTRQPMIGDPNRN